MKNTKCYAPSKYINFPATKCHKYRILHALSFYINFYKNKFMES